MMQLPAKCLAAVLLALGAVSNCLMAHAQAPQEFYRGKTVSVIIGYGAGGGYDTYGRVLARHLGKHLPGNPVVVAKNMPGAGSLRLANYIYNSAPKDGTEIGLVASSALLEPLLGNKQAQFNPVKYGWLGSMSQDVSFCAIRRNAPVQSFQEWLDTKKELIFASSGPGATSDQHPKILKNLFGMNARVVAGYDGTRDGILAMQRGEMDAICGLQVATIKAQFKDLLDQGDLKLIIQMGPQKVDTFGPVPSVFDYAANDFDRQVLDLHFGSLKLARPFMTPPGLEAERQQQLQRAFMDALKDPELLEEAKKVSIEIDPVSGEEARLLLQHFAGLPKAVIEKAKDNLSR